MRDGIHPAGYRLVVFRDISCDFEFLTQSCVKSRDTTEFEGTEYPLVTIDISSASHPFYTGTQKIMDVEGRVQRYYRKYGFKNPEADEDAEAGEGAGEEAGEEAGE